MQPLLQWNKLIGDGGLYTWFNLPVTSEMLYPCSNLFYIDHNIEKALELGQDLLAAPNLVEGLPKKELSDLKFYLGTAYALHGDDMGVALQQ